jgi:hypothetical protein
MVRCPKPRQLLKKLDKTFIKRRDEGPREHPSGCGKERASPFLVRCPKPRQLLKKLDQNFHKSP